MSSQAETRDLKVVGSTINGRFLIKGRLAAGGMGVVYEGEQVPLGRPVAVKILENKAELAHEPHFSERFLLEAAAVAKLSHPNTITLYDYGETEGGDFYYAMEFVDGETLTARVKRAGPLGSPETIHVGMQVAGSLREAHRAGMIHRDLKPGNIMLTERLDDPFFVKVLDFGLVKVMGQTDGIELTQSGMLMGSPRYMAPEQVLGHPLDHRADIYSFGALLYWALTGVPPFRQRSQFEVLRAQVEDFPAPFATVQPEHGSTIRLEQLVFKCLKKDPDQRPQSMDEVALELRTCARELGIEEASLSGAIRSLVPPQPADGVTSASRSLPPGQDVDDISLVRPHIAEDAPTVAPRPTPLPRSAASDDSLAQSVSSMHGSEISQPRSRRGLGIIAAVSVLIFGGLATAGGAFWWSAQATSDDGAVADQVTTAEQPPTPAIEPPTPELPAEAPAATAAAQTRTQVISEPAGARVQRGEVDLGDAPLPITIPEGEAWELTVTLAGYEPRTVLVTAGREQVYVRLAESEAAPSPPEPQSRRATTTARPATNRGSSPQPLFQNPVRPTESVGGESRPPRAQPSTPPATRQNDMRDPWGR